MISSEDSHLVKLPKKPDRIVGHDCVLGTASGEQQLSDCYHFAETELCGVVVL